MFGMKVVLFPIAQYDMPLPTTVQILQCQVIDKGIWMQSRMTSVRKRNKYTSWMSNLDAIYAFGSIHHNYLMAWCFKEQNIPQGLRE